MQSLLEASPWSLEHDDIKGRTVLVLESEIMPVFGEFAWSLLLVQTLKRGIPVKLLAVNHTRQHFSSILRKHALNLDTLEKAGTLSIFVPSQSTSFINDMLWRQIQDFILPTDRDDQEYAAVFIDSLDCLEIIAPYPVDVINFISKCCSLLESSLVYLTYMFCEIKLSNDFTISRRIVWCCLLRTLCTSQQ
jgi:hypothetical protein